MEDNKQMATVPVASIEVAVAQYVTIIKWLIATILIIVTLFVGYIGVQYFYGAEVVETREIKATQDGGGTNIIGGGDISYGSGSAHQNN